MLMGWGGCAGCSVNASSLRFGFLLRFLCICVLMLSALRCCAVISCIHFWWGFSSRACCCHIHCMRHFRMPMEQQRSGSLEDGLEIHFNLSVTLAARLNLLRRRFPCMKMAVVKWKARCRLVPHRG